MTLNYSLKNLTGRALAGLAVFTCADLLLACDGDDRGADGAPVDAPGGEEPAAAPADGLALAPALDPAADLETDVPVCPRSRVTVIRSGGDCPGSVDGAHGKWQGGPLLVTTAPALAAICQYRWEPEGKAAPELTPLQVAPFTAVGSDCEVDWAQGDALSEQLAAPLRDAFYTHIGRLSAGGLPAAAGAPVTVALPDTATKMNVEMNSDHAASMWGIIRSITCPDGVSCNIGIERRLALPLLDDGAVDWTHGGFHGSQNHLTTAIHAAIEGWKGTAGPLVLNLSLGWEPGKFGGGEAPGLMPGPVQGVYRTLQYARCHGAIIVAAAGNVAGDDCVAGPLAPALWENVMGPTIAMCKNAYGVTPAWDPSTQPLVHAVGALDHLDRPLQSTRIGGRPRLAAPGFVAVADGPDGPTSALSGSSVSAAIVSATAALLWSHHPGLTPGQVIGRIYASGEPLLPTALAEFGPPSEIRRVSVCEALSYACAGHCPAKPCTDTAVDTAALAQAAAQAAAALPPSEPAVIDAASLVLADTCEAMCGTTDLYTSKAVDDAPGDVCALDLVAGRDRFTDPQPSYPPCKVCFASGAKVVMVVEADFDGLPLTSAVLEVTDGVTSERYQLGPIASLSSAERTEITLPASATIDPTQDRATLHLTFAISPTETETHSNPISVY